MAGSQKVFLRIVGLIGDGGDPDELPDRVNVSGRGRLIPTIAAGAADVAQGPDSLHEIRLIEPVAFEIVDGMLTYDGKPYVWLSVPNGEWMWRISFDQVRVGEQVRELRDFLFPLDAATPAQIADEGYPGINLAQYSIGAWEPGTVNLTAEAIQQITIYLGRASSAEARIAAEHEHVHQDLNHVDDVAAQTANLLEQANVFAQDQVPPYLQQGALNATYGRKGDDLAPSALVDVSIRPVGATEPSPMSVIDGRIYGRRGRTLAWSEDECETWTTITTAGPAGSMQDIQPTSDGEMLIVTADGLHKSSGWGTENLSFSRKFTTNGSSQMQAGWSLAGDGTKWITTEYAAGSNFPISRYARISLDAGDTWFIGYDSVAQLGQADADASHLHGCAYVPSQDAFYISEGHGPKVGIYVSTDDGATWALTRLSDVSPAHTVIATHPDGLVMGTDSSPGGLYGAPYAGPLTEVSGRPVWTWRTGVEGVPGFAVNGRYDAHSGLVFFGFYTANTGLPPMIVAGSPTSGGKVWEWPGEFEFASTARAYPLGNGRLVATVSMAGTPRQTQLVRGTIPLPVTPNASLADSGSVLGGTSSRGDAVAVGPGASTGSAMRGLAVGRRALISGSQDTTAVGDSAEVGGNSSGTALGASSYATTNSLSVGYLSTSAANSTALGSRSAVTGSSSVAVGDRASVQSGAGTAIGSGAGTTAPNSVAVGSGATASHFRAVVLGAFTESTALHQVAVGTRHLELQEPNATVGVASAPGAARLFTRLNDDGKTEVCVRFPTGAAIPLAVEP